MRNQQFDVHTFPGGRSHPRFLLQRGGPSSPGGRGSGTRQCDPRAGRPEALPEPAQASPRHRQRLLTGPTWPWTGALFLPFEVGLNWGCDKWLSGQSACHTSMRTAVQSPNTHIKTSQECAGKVAHWAVFTPQTRQPEFNFLDPVVEGES